MAYTTVYPTHMVLNLTGIFLKLLSKISTAYHFYKQGYTSTLKTLLTHVYFSKIRYIVIKNVL